MWYTEGIIKMQKCVIGGYLQIQQKSGTYDQITDHHDPHSAL